MRYIIDCRFNNSVRYKVCNTNKDVKIYFYNGGSVVLYVDRLPIDEIKFAEVEDIDVLIDRNRRVIY